MYFDFEDYHPDIAPVGRSLTRLEVVLLSIIFHLVMVIMTVSYTHLTLPTIYSV